FLSTCGGRAGLKQAAWFGYPFMVGTLAWCRYMGNLPWLLLSLTQAAYMALFTAGTALLAARWMGRPGEVRSWRSHLAALTIFPAAWIVVEWLRTLGTLSIPWGVLASTQVEISPLVATSRWW